MGPACAPAAAAPGSDWGIPVPLEGDNLGSAGAPRVAVAADGTAFAVWAQSDGLRTSIWASRFAPAAGWQAAVAIDDEGNYSALDPAVAVDAVGGALALWRQDNGTHWNLWSSRYAPGAGWGAPALAEASTYSVGSPPALASNASGVAFAAWGAYDGFANSIMGNRFVPGTGWQTATLLEALPNDAFNPDVAVAANGDAVAVWHQDDGLRWSVLYNAYDDGVGWGAAGFVESDNLSSAERPRVAMQPDGTAVAVWSQFDGATSIEDVWASRFTEAEGWRNTTRLEALAFASSGPLVASDGLGDFHVVFEVHDGARGSLWASRCESASGWGVASPIESADGDTAAPALAAAGGFAAAAWAQEDGGRLDLWAARFEPAAGWQAPRMIEADVAGDAHDASTGLDGSGNSIVVWRRFAGAVHSIFANRYAEGLAPIAVAIAGPQEGRETANATVLVEGSATPGAYVAVDGLAAFVGAGGNWSVRLALAEGPNRIEAHAWDAADNHAVATVNITFTSPRASLEENLSAAAALLEAARRELNSTRENLSAAQSDLEALAVRVNATEDELARLAAAPPADLTAALLMGAAGAGLGAAGLALAWRASRRPRAP